MADVEVRKIKSVTTSSWYENIVPTSQFIYTHTESKQAALRASRARPSLLVPLAGSVGFGLRCLTQLLPGTAPVAKGVRGFYIFRFCMWRVFFFGFAEGSDVVDSIDVIPSTVWIAAI